MNSERNNNSRMFGADALKLFSSLGAAALFLFGYSYSTTYFLGFGLSPAEVDIDFVQGVAIGAFLLWNGAVFTLGLLIVAVITIITLYSRLWISQEWFYMCLLIVFVLVCFGAIRVGASIADRHGNQITSGEAGKIAYCVLKEDVQFPDVFVETFNDLTSKSKVRKIYETEHTMYLSFVLDPVPANLRGQSLMLSKRDVAYCRVVGQ